MFLPPCCPFRCVHTAPGGAALSPWARELFHHHELLKPRDRGRRAPEEAQRQPRDHHGYCTAGCARNWLHPPRCRIFGASTPSVRLLTSPFPGVRLDEPRPTARGSARAAQPPAALKRFNSTAPTWLLVPQGVCNSSAEERAMALETLTAIDALFRTARRPRRDVAFCSASLHTPTYASASPRSAFRRRAVAVLRRSSRAAGVFRALENLWWVARDDVIPTADRLPVPNAPDLNSRAS